jgi:hypothetical protein
MTSQGGAPESNFEGAPMRINSRSRRRATLPRQQQVFALEAASSGVGGPSPRLRCPRGRGLSQRSFAVGLLYVPR